MSEPESPTHGSVSDEADKDTGAELMSVIASRGYRGLLLVSALLGIPVALIAWGFLAAVHGLENVVWDAVPHALGMDAPAPWYGIVVLALAGLERLSLADLPAHPLDPERFVPAPGQGILAVETRQGSEAEALCRALDHGPTALAARAERALVAALGGDCSLPLGAWCHGEEDSLRLVSVLATPDGRRLIRAEASEGSKKLFSITPEGEACLKENAAAVEGILARIDLTAAAFASHATPDSVREAVKTLKQALHMRRGPWSAEETERVRTLIEKTARDIVGAGQG